MTFAVIISSVKIGTRLSIGCCWRHGNARSQNISIRDTHLFGPENSGLSTWMIKSLRFWLSLCVEMRFGVQVATTLAMFSLSEHWFKGSGNFRVQIKWVRRMKAQPFQHQQWVRSTRDVDSHCTTATHFLQFGDASKTTELFGMVELAYCNSASANSNFISLLFCWYKYERSCTLYSSLQSREENSHIQC